MREKYILGILMVALFADYEANAQQQSLYTQYMLNGLVINPAYSATDDAANVTLLHRQQWVGLEGAPQTTTASFYSPIVKDKLSGAILLTHDKIGVNNGSGVDFSIAPSVRLTRDIKMALGISAGLKYGVSLLTSLDYTSDPLFAQNEQNLYTMFGAGVMVYSDKFYAGISFPQLINVALKNKNNGLKGERYFNYAYLTAGMLIPINDQIDLKPNALVWYAEENKTQVDLNLNAIIRKQFWVGVSWRSFESISGILQIQISKGLQIGYAYDAGTSVSRRVSGGSHEILLTYRFQNNRRRVLSTRWF